MKKKFLAMMSAFILTITCIAPLSIKAEFIKPTQTTVHIYDQDGVRMNSCILADGAGCGTSWNSTHGFEKYEVYFRISVPNNYTVRQRVGFKMTGLAMKSTSDSDALAFAVTYSNSQGWFSLREEFSAVEHWYGATNTSEIDAWVEFKNTTGADIYEIQYTYTNFGGNSSANLTVFSIPYTFTSIYDEEGRLIETIQNGVNTLHQDLTSTQTLIEDFKDRVEENHIATMERLNLFRNEVSTAFVNLLSNLTENFTILIRNIQYESSKIISAIRGDDKEVDSKDEVDNTTNDLDNTINDYENIENSVIDDFNNNFGSITPNNDLITNNDFINTSTFVAAQMTRIYESNSIIKMTITFGLIIGLAFTVIGISVRR